MRNRLLIRFEKTDLMRFIGHLDLVRVMQRAVKRAGIPVAYSEGFNPHQLFSLSLPLGLGVAGLSEYGEIRLTEQIDPEDFISRMNEALPMHLNIIGARYMPENEKKTAASVIAADYRYDLGANCAGDVRVSEFLAQQEIIASNGKDIRSDIYSMSATKDGLSMLISAGSQRNLKPELLLEAFFCETVVFSPGRLVRKELYKNNGERLVPLFEV